MSPATTPGLKSAEEKLVKCRKCGAELRSEQKVCIVCGTRTAAGGNFAVDEKEPFQITAKMKKGALVAAGLVVLLVVIQLLRITPPDAIAEKWFKAMASRNYGNAERFHSENFTSSMQQGLSDTRAVSDFIFDELNTKQAKETFGQTVYTPGNPKEATVTITLTYPDQYQRPIQVIFAKIGRRWMVDRLVY